MNAKISTGVAGPARLPLRGSTASLAAIDF
jgi:hypothetical protein